MSTNEESREKFLTVKEAASLLNLSKRTLERMVNMPDDEPGSIPHYRLTTPGARRRRVRFLESELRRWMEAACPPRADFERIHGKGLGG